ncbi:heavy metal-binding domain-containing protein [bacterium]|nr:heavy metal-binding domain-containing protein [bacterium]MBP9807371.1 heavy metal-binding domain-containing protein [bacterium]
MITGLSGNELFCLNEKGYTPGNLVIGNSVFSLGFVGSLTSGLKTLGGGEIHELTELIREGREMAYMRMIEEARRHVGAGVTGVTNQLIFHDTNVEYLAIGSAVHRDGESNKDIPFSTSANGQELYCQIDCGFHPLRFVFGNVAYSIGIGGGVMGTLRSLKAGEVVEFSQMLNKTRHLAIERISHEAKEAGANAVLGIQTTIAPLLGMQEMVMTGTASFHEELPPQYSEVPITSDLTNEEMWNVIALGYCPIRLVMGVSIFSIGFAGGLKAMFKSFVRGEIKELTYMIYQARVKALSMIAEDAENFGADEVVGVKTYVYDLGGGMVELLAIGTGIKKMPNMKVHSPLLIPQAIIRDSETFTNRAATQATLARQSTVSVDID